MKIVKIVGLCAVVALISSCVAPKKPEAPVADPFEDELIAKDESARETKNVTYTGIVRPAGISIYQQGSHRLVLEDQRFVLLESDSASLDLNGYVGEEAEVFGAVRPTVEEGGMIMRVESIKLIKEEEELPPADDIVVEDEEDELPIVDEDQPEPPSEEPVEEPIESAPPTVEPVDLEDAGEESVEPTPDADEDEEPPVEEIREPEEASAAMQEQIDAMAKENYATSRWTQQFCTEHIGFCIPIHKNWWWNSFGNTTSYLWHVELGNAAVENLGDGPIQVNLLNGTSVSKKATDGQVRIQGDMAIGYRDWDDNTHFEVIGDASLIEAVTYITNNLSTYTE